MMPYGKAGTVQYRVVPDYSSAVFPRTHSVRGERATFRFACLPLLLLRNLALPSRLIDLRWTPWTFWNQLHEHLKALERRWAAATARR